MSMPGRAGALLGNRRCWISRATRNCSWFSRSSFSDRLRSVMSRMKPTKRFSPFTLMSLKLISIGISAPSLRNAAQVAFHQVIMRAGFHGRHGDVLADAAGNNNERQIEAAVLQDFQGGRRVELGQVVVGQDQVPRFGAQRGLEGRRGFDPLEN